MLGRDVVAAFRRGAEPYTVLSGDRTEADHTMDITDEAATGAALDAALPDVVINCAAWTDVDGAEAHTDEAFRANAWGAWNVAYACAARGLPLCHVSTDYVFNGEKGAPYNEFDAPDPIGAYGRSKWAGEQAVQRVGPCWIVRSQWLFGPGGRNFVNTVLRRLEEHDTLNVVDDQRGAPSYTADVAGMIRTIVDECPPGVYHANNAGEATWYQFARAILELSGHDPERARPITTAEYPTPARRPRDSRLDRMALRLQGKDAARHWRAALEDYMRERAAASPD